MMLDDPLRDRIEAWLAVDPDPTTRDELERLAKAADAGGSDGEAAEAELRDRFAGRLGFGTAGLRAPLGAGPLRMNRVVVEQLAAALVRWIADRHPRTDRPVTVVVGWDARHRSAELAGDVARVVAAAGGRGLLLPGPCPTPVLASAVRQLGTDAGVMCTASHNPPGDNGAKVYLDDGAQIVGAAEAELAAAMAVVAESGQPVLLAPPDDPGVVRLDAAIVDTYVERVLRSVAPLGPDAPRTPLRIVYSPLHGVGAALAGRLLRRSGFSDVELVPDQAAPDPDFPTTPYPDPEEPAAFTLALDRARARDAQLVLLNDPDADRLGVAVPTAADRTGGRGLRGANGEAAPAPAWRLLSGNEIGALLCEHVLACTAGDDRLVVTSFVSSRLLAAIARHHGVHHIEVPTGFKWIIRPALAHPELRFVFGFEESLGFSFDAELRDKDGLAAAVGFARMVAALHDRGDDVEGALERLSRRHGHHASLTWSARMTGLGAAARLRAVVESWRVRPPGELAGRRVVSVRDLSQGGGGMPPADAVIVTGEGGERVVLRPSGTEPKVKVHLEVVEPVPAGPTGYARARQAGAAALEELRAAVAADLGLAP
jgi:phosphomannomutase